MESYYFDIPGNLRPFSDYCKERECKFTLREKTYNWEGMHTRPSYIQLPDAIISGFIAIMKNVSIFADTPIHILNGGLNLLEGSKTTYMTTNDPAFKGLPGYRYIDDTNHGRLTYIAARKLLRSDISIQHDELSEDMNDILDTMDYEIPPYKMDVGELWYHYHVSKEYYEFSPGYHEYRVYFDRRPNKVHVSAEVFQGEFKMPWGKTINWQDMSLSLYNIDIDGNLNIVRSMYGLVGTPTLGDVNIFTPESHDITYTNLIKLQDLVYSMRKSRYMAF